MFRSQGLFSLPLHLISISRYSLLLSIITTFWRGRHAFPISFRLPSAPLPLPLPLSCCHTFRPQIQFPFLPSYYSQAFVYSPCLKREILPGESGLIRNSNVLIAGSRSLGRHSSRAPMPSTLVILCNKVSLCLEKSAESGSARIVVLFQTSRLNASGAC